MAGPSGTRLVATLLRRCGYAILLDFVARASYCGTISLGDFPTAPLTASRFVHNTTKRIFWSPHFKFTGEETADYCGRPDEQIE